MTTHFTAGVTNASKFSALGLSGSPSPTFNHQYFDDFDTGNVRFKARERYSFGWSNPRAIYGSSGA